MAKYRPVKNHVNIFEYDTKNGKRYRIRKTFNDQYGKRQEFSKNGFQTWRDADVELKKIENEINTRSSATFVEGKRTLDDVFEEMCNFKINSGVWKASTELNVKGQYRRYLKDFFGKKQVAKITRNEYENFLANLADTSATTTIKVVNSTMQSILNYAEIHDIIIKNKLRNPVMKPGRAPYSKLITTEQYHSWISMAQKILSKYEYNIVLLNSLGERRSELLGLRLKDLTFSGDTCSINWSMARTWPEPDGTTLKTKSSYRTNVITGKFVTILKEVIEITRLTKTRLHQTFNEDDFIIISLRTGKPLQANGINSIMNKVNELIPDFRMTPHKLRHYFATAGMNNPNISDVEVMHWLGHSNLNMTASYTRQTTEQSKKTFENIKDNFALDDMEQN